MKQKQEINQKPPHDGKEYSTMNQIDYYSVLGITKDADKKEIRIAYRKLAFQYHPDRNADNPEAAEKMKQLNEAYAVLSDESKKKQYDSMKEQYGDTAYTHFRDSYSEHDIFSGSDINKIFEELARDFGFRGFDELFREFYGTGYKAFNFRKNGFSIKGFIFKGPGLFGEKQTKISETGAKSFPGPVDMFKSVVGKIAMFNTPKSGKDQFDKISLTEDHARDGGPYAYLVKDSETKLLVKIPKGMKDGQKIRLAGQGKTGKNGGENGDLYLKVYIKRPLIRAMMYHFKRLTSGLKSSPFGEK
ncbi:MAG: DnaJ domain-containing protein [Desulfobacteraceae bacterium]|jgi:curved DNA-binding protein